MTNDLYAFSLLWRWIYGLSLQMRLSAGLFFVGLFSASIVFFLRDEIVTSIGSAWPAMAALVVVNASVSLFVARAVLAPVRVATTAVRRIANGELEGWLPSGGANDIGSLLGAVGEMRERIRTMVVREMTQRRVAQGRLVDAIEAAREGIVVVDRSGRIARSNSQAALLFGMPIEDVEPGAPLSNLAKSAGQDGASYLRLRPDAPVAEFLLPEGRWLRVSQSRTRDGGAVVVCSDVTDLRSAMLSMEAANRRLDAAVSSMVQGICLFDAHDALRLANARFCLIYRLPEDRVVPGISLHSLVGLMLGAGILSEVDEAGASLFGPVDANHAGMRHHHLSDGRVVAVVRQPVADGGWVVTFEDVTEQRKIQDRLRYTEYHDLLTGLGNRLQLCERLDEILNAKDQHGWRALLQVDLYRFKAINEAFGQSAGDDLLRAAAKRIKGCLRGSDFVCRIGGDQFMVVSDLNGRDDLEHLGRRLTKALAKPFQIGDERITVGACIGIAVFPGDGTSRGQLFKASGMALDRAKGIGVGAVGFADAVADAAVQDRRALEMDLHAALARDEFELFYQPLFDVERGSIGGFEALLRWRHPVRGMVSPADFIPLAEETGLIVPIGEWVLRRACREAVEWPGDLKVAVNVSPPQLLSGSLVRAVCDALSDAGLPASRLELEITESVLLAQSSAVLDVLRSFRDLGVRVAMDDFGTGYSSLSTLRSFPFDKIKVDQSFIKSLGDGTDTIVRAMVSLGRTLGMRVTAEGVETESQFAWLLAQGCHEAQGYLISRPCPASGVAALLAAQAEQGRQ